MTAWHSCYNGLTVLTYAFSDLDVHVGYNLRVADIFDIYNSFNIFGNFDVYA